MARILIIDDTDEMLAMLQKVLRRSGHEVVAANNGETGLRCLQQQPIDLVVTDIFMPEKDGIEIIRNLRRHHPQVKVIAISGGGEVSPQSYLTIAEKLGAAHTFYKPFNVKEFLQAVHKLVED